MVPVLALTVDCADPVRLVRFWSQALGYQPEPAPDGSGSWVTYWRSLGVPGDELLGCDGSPESIVDPHGGGPRIWFQRVPEPKVGKNRLHLDLEVSGGRDVPIAARRAAIWSEVTRLVALGAQQLRVLAADGLDHYAVVLADPEGNEFCVG